jgi:hypothetical protein
MPQPIVPMTFATLQRRMLTHVRSLLANGELTERGLARMVGISQPHIHNVLKGVRVLTADIGDLLIGALGFSLLELAEPQELGTVLEGRREPDGIGRQVRVAQGKLSPYDRFPDVGTPGDWVRLPEAIVAAMQRPLVTAFVADLEVETVFGGATHLLLELADPPRVTVYPECWYALRWGGAGFIRQVRRENGALVVLGQRSWRPSSLPDRIPLGDLPALSVIRGRVEWCGPDPRALVSVRQTGRFLPSPTFS